MNPLLLAACLAPGGTRDEVRAVWVTRFEYRTEADVRKILSDCAGVGFNAVLFQVRGEADAYYRSDLEPWAARLGGRDPGFDPLDVACREARRLGLELHAWINVMTAWRGKEPPGDPGHVTLRHPEWIVVDPKGRRQKWNDHYVFLNPCLDEVRRHVAAVAGDIARRYPVAGVHLDYVRFPEGEWSHDKRTRDLFGARPERDPAAWDRFRREAVTRTVAAIRRSVREARPEAILSAAIYPTASAREKVFQEAEEWAKEGRVDWVFPMIYEDGGGEFAVRVREGYARFGGVPCLPGIGAYKHDGGPETARQIGICRGGFAVFSYSSLFVSVDGKRREDAKLCRARREAVKEALARR